MIVKKRYYKNVLLVDQLWWTYKAKYIYMYIFIYNYDFLSCLGEMEVWIGYEFLSTKMLVQNNQLCSIQYLLLFFFFHISYLNITENTRDYIELLDFNIWIYIFKQSLLKNRFDISFVSKRNDHCKIPMWIYDICRS